MARVIHVEVVQRLESRASVDQIKIAVNKMIDDKLKPSAGTFIKRFDDVFLVENIEAVLISEGNEISCKNGIFSEFQFVYHIYRLNDEGRQRELLESEEDGEELSASSHWTLPCTDFHGLWESLVFESSLKDDLLSFVETTLLFSDKGVDSNFISWNRVVLLHGPPGTGKTSLCKALAQKLSIRMADRYNHCELVEINTHSLFSKWFSESGKLVMKMFSKIHEILETESSLVCVLIDEVESLAHARQSAVKGLEPSDAIRVVNAVLTQIDHIKSYPNVLILTTSNITAGIDLAFVDRADIKQYIGYPSVAAVYEIFKSCVKELQRTNIIHSKDNIVTLKLLELSSFQPSESTNTSLKLYDISKLSEGFSGRTLRKLPFLAHAYFVQKPSVSLTEFLNALEKAVGKFKQDCEELKRT
ncbi:Transitional endoplasmic reticulum ATPase TER94 [Gryllus bimaculatus]|nr:Transitional endoplasmic reticulum ATPase TER94 [Gryllus bimaculatus]